MGDSNPDGGGRGWTQAKKPLEQGTGSDTGPATSTQGPTQGTSPRSASPQPTKPAVPPKPGGSATPSKGGRSPVPPKPDVPPKPGAASTPPAAPVGGGSASSGGTRPAVPPKPPKATTPVQTAAPPKWTAGAATKPRDASGPLGAAQQKAMRGELKLDEVDQLPKAQRRWTMDVQKALGIPGVLGQGKTLASTVATTQRMADNRPTSDALRSAHADLNPDGEAFDAFNALAAFEKIAQPKAADRDTLKAAIQKARLAEKEWENAADPVLLKDLAVVEGTLRAAELHDQITGLGMPPWSMKDGMRATAAKLELDLLSMMDGDPKLERFDGSATPTHWVKRGDKTGIDAKSFLCKAPAARSPVQGVPNGGEVPREGLSAVVASKLAGRLGLDMNVPETHAVPVDNRFLQPDLRNQNGSTVTCSVQEVRANTGDMKGITLDQRASFSADDCAALTILDIVTLNTDRHVENLLIGTDGRLVPIDHGACMPNNQPDALERMANTLGAPRNALLSLPGSHEPMSKEMRAKLAALDPSAFAAETKHMRDAIEGNTPALKGLVSDGALEMTARATLFLKTAAAVEVDGQTLSPASIQIALGKYAQQLFAQADDGSGYVLSWDAFIDASTQVALEALQQQPLTKVMSLMDPAEKELLGLSLVKKGYQFMGVEEADYPGIGHDPSHMARTLVSGAGSKDDPKKYSRAQRAAMTDPAEKVIARLADVRIQNMEGILTLLPPAQAAAFRKEIAADRARMPGDPPFLSRMVERVTGAVRAHLTRQLEDLKAQYDLGESAITFRETEIRKGEFYDAAEGLAKMVGFANKAKKFVKDDANV